MNTLPQNTVVFKTNTTGIVQGNVILMSGEMSELNGINILVSDCNDLQLFISGTTAMLRFVSNIFSNGKENVPLIFYFYFTIPEPLEDDEIHQITLFMLNLPGGNPVHELQKMTCWRSFIEPVSIDISQDQVTVMWPDYMRAEMIFGNAGHGLVIALNKHLDEAILVFLDDENYIKTWLKVSVKAVVENLLNHKAVLTKTNIGDGEYILNREETLLKTILVVNVPHLTMADVQRTLRLSFGKKVRYG